MTRVVETRRIEGLHDVAVAGTNLREVMTGRGFTDQQIADIFGGNGRRYLEANLPSAN